MKKLFFITYKGRPAGGSPDFSEIGGAFINIWVDAPTKDAALSIAHREIEEAGLVPETVEDACQVDDNDYEKGDSGYEYFEQALIDGIVLVFHTYSAEPQDEDSIN